MRPDGIYISRLARSALFYCPRPEGETVDQLADQIIMDWLKANHSQVLDHLKAQAEADKSFRDKYGLRSEPIGITP